LSGTYFVSPNDFGGILFRLGLALLFGAAIGWEREVRHKPAGFRTNILVSFGAALFVLVPIQVGAAEESADALSRVIQGIATGVGFVGGGAILRESHSRSGSTGVRGLTSAAAIWVSAALGIVAGAGLWQLGLIGTILSFVVLELFKKIEPSG
jgi:putative Mg2+ transporter-C (MgtC) family protein